MWLERLEIENLRAIVNARLEEIPRFAVILGPNGSGKSTVVFALRALRSRLQGQQFLRAQDYSSFAQTEEIAIRATLSFGDDERRQLAHAVVGAFSELTVERKVLEDEVSRLLSSDIRISVGWHFNGAANSIDRLSGPEWRCGDGRQLAKMCVSVVTDVFPGLPPKFTDGREPTTESMSSALLSSITNNLGPHIAARLAFLGPTRKPAGEVAPVSARDFSYDAIDLANAIYYYRGHGSTQYQELQTLLRGIFPEVIEVLAPPGEGRQTVGIGVVERGAKFPLSLDTMSSGLAEALSILSRLAFSPSGAVICLEEPEVHFHFKAFKKLLGELLRVSSDKQIILVTHSTETVYDTRVEPSAFWFFTRPNHGPILAERVHRERDADRVERELSEEPEASSPSDQ